MRNQRLISSIESWPRATILCVGDVMLDRFVYGTAGRISPEAPIPVLLTDRDETMLGGAGNVVRNLADLGARVVFATVTGDDADGSVVESLVAALPACSACIVRDPSRRTSVKTRYLAHSQQLLRVDAEDTTAVSGEVLDRLLDYVRASLPAVDLVVLSDYAKGLLSDRHASRFIDACRDAGKPVFVDPKGMDYGRYRGASLIKPNLKELSEAARMTVHDDASVEAAARSLVAETNIAAVLATRGASGMMLVRDGLPAVSFRSLAREIYDVSGAGDTVAATLAAGAATGLDLADAVHIACIAAGIVVGKIGTATVTGNELMRELEGARHGGGDVRILSEAEALQRAKVWRRTGWKIGFAIGGFEALTAELAVELGAARNRCDKLMVGLGSATDEQTRILVASLASVDLVVLLENPNSDSFLESLRPDLVVRF
jgi:D-beta-D-heptose 7-phosphate kinase/D-beta-D-heptose 1-phosphate adenosyltransferase